MVRTPIHYEKREIHGPCHDEGSGPQDSNENPLGGCALIGSTLVPVEAETRAQSGQNHADNGLCIFGRNIKYHLQEYRTEDVERILRGKLPAGTGETGYSSRSRRRFLILDRSVSPPSRSLFRLESAELILRSNGSG